MYIEKYDLSGRVAVATGGGRNIGLACEQALAEAGAKNIIAEIDLEVAAARKTELHSAGFDADIIKLDVTQPTAVSGTVQVRPSSAPSRR